MKKKIDQRIKSMIENGIALNQRSLFVIVGDNGRDQVNSVFNIPTGYESSLHSIKSPSIN